MEPILHSVDSQLFACTQNASTLAQNGAACIASTAHAYEHVLDVLETSRVRGRAKLEAHLVALNKAAQNAAEALVAFAEQYGVMAQAARRRVQIQPWFEVDNWCLPCCTAAPAGSADTALGALHTTVYGADIAPCIQPVEWIKLIGNCFRVDVRLVDTDGRFPEWIDRPDMFCLRVLSFWTDLNVECLPDTCTLRIRIVDWLFGGLPLYLNVRNQYAVLSIERTSAAVNVFE